MKEIKVTVISSSMLELQENAEKGDRINLATLNKIDSTFITDIIEKNKTDELNKRIVEARKEWQKQSSVEQKESEAKFKQQLSEKELILNTEHQKEIDNLKDEISDLNSKLKVSEDGKDKDKKLIEEQIENKYSSKIQDLENQLKNKDLELANKYNTEITSLKNQLDNVQKQYESEKQLLESQLIQKHQEETSKLAHENDLLKQESKTKLLEADNKSKEEIDKYKEKLKTLQLQYDDLYRTKSSLSVKMIGENLESWCNDSYNSAKSLGGFENCTWDKDTTLVKDEGENGNGTKADYIFKAYSSDKDDKTLVTSACLDMKSENPNSVTKKKNSDYYKKLNSDRNKKNCEYAILVSELEIKSDNDVPVFKVDQYPNMYVVRPSYFLTFLGILMNLGKKYSYLIEQKAKEDEKFKSADQLRKEFEGFKDTYLNSPLKSLETKVSEIKKDADDIIKKGNSISQTADEIINSTLETIKSKIETLSIKKLPSIEKKLDKLNDNNND